MATSVLPNWMGNMSATSRTVLRALMQSMGSRSGGLRSVRHCPASALPLLDKRRSASDHWLTVMALRGATALAKAR